jgi:superfamily II DNA or RNA helicase
MTDKSYSNYIDPESDISEFSNILLKHEFNTHKSENKREFVYQEPNQLLLRNYISKHTIYENVLLYYGLGVGKCMKKDTPILMHDGTIKKVQDIKVGDLLMGDDSRPRTVLSLARGEDNMYDIIPAKGEKYTVNEEHILCLKASGYPLIREYKKDAIFKINWLENNKFMSKSFSYKENDEHDRLIKKLKAQEILKTIKNEQVMEISVRDYLKLSNNYKNILKGYKTSIDFPEKDLEFDPYVLGYWLGDGKNKDYITEFTDNSNSFLNLLKTYNLNQNKHIPHIYKCNSRENRLKLLAGIIDADGLYTRGMFYIFQSIENEKMINDIIYLVRSLGFSGYKNISKHGKNIRITISGKGIDQIPTMITKKKGLFEKEEKEVLMTDIKVVSVGRDNYYGFTLDGNCRYLIGDFTVTHNTCASISIAEGFKEYINNMGRKILVLVKNKNIQRNFLNELLSKCTANEYINEEDRYRISDNVKKEIYNKSIRKINKSYQFLTYGTFVNRVLGLKEYEKDEYGQNVNKFKRVNGEIKRRKAENTIKNLNNTVIIVDEAHNITNNDVYIALYQLLSKSYNYKLILLTGTPIYDNSKEIFEISNLLNVNTPENIFPIRNELLKESNEPLLTKTQSSYINNNVLKGGIISITELGKQKLAKALNGKVSYLQSNVLTNPEKIEMGEILSKRTGSIKVVYCQMSSYQYLVYLDALKYDIKNDSNYDISNTIQNIEAFENLEESPVPMSSASSLYKNSSDASTMVYPNRTFGKQGFQNIITKEDGKYIIHDKSLFKENLIKYSSKLYKLLQNIKNSTGNIFVYSNYVSFGGTLLIKLLLSENNYTEFKLRQKNDNFYKNFVLFDDSVNIETREKIRKIFNSKENKDGKIIKIIIGSPILSEGITLKNVRQVHILEPSWNMSRINQIIGRAVRNYSHHDLQPKDRNVQIFKYVSIYYPKKQVEENDSLSFFFIDREKYILSEEKDRSNKKIERLLKEISFDCDLMKTRNKLIGKNGSPECDYTVCEFKCLVNVKENSDKSEHDKSTYNLYIPYFDKFDIEFISKTLRDMFKKYFIWHIDDIIQYIKDISPYISNEAIFITLSNFTTNKVLFEDMYSREGFLINKGPFYIFNSSDININTSIYSKILDFTVNKNKYTLDQYIESKFPNFKEIPEEKETEFNKVVSEIAKEHDMLETDIAFNKQLIKDNKIFGSYRQRGTKDHPYGQYDGKFRIIDLREKDLIDTIDGLDLDEDIDSMSQKDEIEDKRKIISGMWIGSYKKSKLKEIFNYLKIPTGGIDITSFDKDELGKLIEKYFIENNKVLK